MAPHPHRIEPGSRPHLAHRDARGPDEPGKAEAKQRLDALQDRLADLQARLWAGGQHAVLVVLQGMDAAGKDGTIKSVLSGVNPQGVDIVGFKAPTPEELAHDFLWRVHRHAPARGRLAVFNRSHYEDVLVVRVRALAPEAVWRKRYRQIADFERLLAETGTTILKFFLHIDREEQRQRLQERLDDPAKRWKFNRGDLAERARWDDYMEAYEEALERTSAPHAPWYVVPANRNWYRNLVVAETLEDALERLDLRYPEPSEDLSGLTVE